MTTNQFKQDPNFTELLAQDPELADIITRLNRTLTPEEIALEKEQSKREVLDKGFLPPNDEYIGSSQSPMEVVENNPRSFIIEECIPACIELWKKNIYTFMVSDHLNERVCWIEFISDNLSDENKEIFSQLEGDDIIKFSYHPGCINLGINCVGIQAQTRLVELAQQFQMQDVPYGEAYITLQEYLVRCGCYDEVENPTYIPMTEPWNMDLPLDQLGVYLTKYDEWQNSDRSKKTLRVFNQSKVTKPLETYFANTGAIYDGERVYLSNYHYQKHKNFVQYLTQTQDSKHKA